MLFYKKKKTDGEEIVGEEVIVFMKTWQMWSWLT